MLPRVFGRGKQERLPEVFDLLMESPNPKPSNRANQRNSLPAIVLIFLPLGSKCSSLGWEEVGRVVEEALLHEFSALEANTFNGRFFLSLTFKSLNRPAK